MYNRDTNVALDIILLILVAGAAIFVSQCKNALADADLAKVSPTAKADYQAYNTETWTERKILGGNTMKKAVFATYTAIAKENGITVYDAVRDTRAKFAGQFRSKFRSISSFLSLPTIRNAHRTDNFGVPAVIVHFTWQKCSGSGDDYHCFTEHDEVTIPEINLPNMEVEGNVGIDYKGFDMSIE